MTMTTPDLTEARRLADEIDALIRAYGMPGRLNTEAAAAAMLRALADELERLRAQVAELKDQRAEAESMAANAEARLRAAKVAPAGWRLVPVEPTIGMQQAALNVSRANVSCGMTRMLTDGCELWASAEVYRAMLAASPAAPAQQAEPVTASDWRKLVETAYELGKQGREIADLDAEISSPSLTVGERER